MFPGHFPTTCGMGAAPSCWASRCCRSKVHCLLAMVQNTMKAIYAGKESQPRFHLESRTTATKAREGATMRRERSRASLRRKLEGSIVRQVAQVTLMIIYIWHRAEVMICKAHEKSENIDGHSCGFHLHRRIMLEQTRAKRSIPRTELYHVCCPVLSVNPPASSLRPGLRAQCPEQMH